MLTVLCLYVRGPYPYTAEYVYRLERMVRRYLARPFRFVCLTDRPEELPGVDTIVVESMQGVVPDNGAGYWTKLRVFDPELGLVGRVLYLDLDVIVVNGLGPIVDFPAELALTSDAFVQERSHLCTDRYGRTLVRRFNGSVMVWDAGTQGFLWERWSPADAQRLSTDQDWIGEQAQDAAAMPLAWFPRMSHLVRDAAFAAAGGPYPPGATVVLTKKPKQHEAVRVWPWLDAAWGGWAA